jgi:nucleoside-diphosphate-sugar epimerase
MKLVITSIAMQRTLQTVKGQNSSYRRRIENIILRLNLSFVGGALFAISINQEEAFSPSAIEANATALCGLFLLLNLSVVCLKYIRRAVRFLRTIPDGRGEVSTLISFAVVALTFFSYQFIAGVKYPVVELSILFGTMFSTLVSHEWIRPIVKDNGKQIDLDELLSERMTREKTIVVIGGAGFIGSGVLSKLLEKGYYVRLIDSFMFGKEAISQFIGHENLSIFESDFRNMDSIVSAMEGASAVVHLGAIVGDPACALDEDFTLEVNLMATRMIAECAKGFGIQKFVFASTCSVYGASDEVLNENSALNPVSLYARSKIACEKILIEMTDDKFKPTILRFGTVYGLSGRTRFDLVINLLTAKAITEGKITVFGEDQWRPFVHVDDASLAVTTAVEAPIELAGCQTFNVGSDCGNMTLGQAGQLIKKLVPTAELIASGSDGDRRNYRVDFSKIKNTLGFETQWSVEQGVKQVISAFESGRVTDYHATMYSNVKYLTEEAQKTGLRTDSHRMRKLVEESVDQVISFN